MRCEFMDLRDVEMSLGIQFPELFHTINNSGMMDHLSHSREWVEDKIANDMNYVWLGDFFGEWMGNCYLFAFENLLSACDERNECLKFDLKITRNVNLSIPYTGLSRLHIEYPAINIVFCMKMGKKSLK